MRITFILISILFLTSCNIFTGTPKEAAPNVLFIVIDTLGARHMSVYDPTLNTTPAMARLAEKSLVFEKAYSTAPWTKPAISSMFTSLYPRQHTVQKLKSEFPDRFITMADILKKKGYATDAVISHTLLKEGTGFEKGFDSYILAPFEGNVHNAIVGKAVSDLAIKRVKSHFEDENKKPFFQFLHYFDPHFNYQHHPEFDRSSWYKGPITPGMGFRDLRKRIPELTEDDRKYLVDLYHEEIEYTDVQVSRVLETYKEMGILDNTIVIITADHGEEFLEHGELGHTRTLYDELIHVPLIIYWSKIAEPKRVKENVSIVDILPTVLTSIGFDPLPPHFEGISLISGNKLADLPKRHIFSEVDFKSSAIEAIKSGVIRENHKLIDDHLNEEKKIFDLEKDPAELSNIIEKEEELANDLQLFLDEHIETGSGESGEGLVHTEEDLEQLRSLGYL
jgi:choline-sulfatase